MMRRWHFYNGDGVISSHYFSATNDRDLQLNTPDGWLPIEGTFDPCSQCVDVASGLVVDYRPEAPSDNHSWNEKSRRWEKRQDVIEREIRAVAARKRIAELESRQHRRVRELLEASDPLLKAISSEIASLRDSLIDEMETTAR